MNYKYDQYDYIEDAERRNTKLGMKEGVDGVLGKFICENDIKYTYPVVTPIYWDIETFNTEHFEVPTYDDDNSHISMICAVRNNHAKIWLFEAYSYDVSTIT